MEQQAEVIAVEADEAVISCRRASACGDCAGKASCATLGSWSERNMQLRLKNTIAAGVGDTVLLEVPDHAVLKTAFWLYALPMLAFIVAGLVARFVAVELGLPAAEAIAAAAGLIAVLASYLAWKFYFSSRNINMDITMTRVLSEPCHSVQIQPPSSSD